jgi:hypothetical protein
LDQDCYLDDGNAINRGVFATHLVTGSRHSFAVCAVLASDRTAIYRYPQQSNDC